MTVTSRWIAGIHAVETALTGGRVAVERVLVDRRRRDGRLRRLVERAGRTGVPVERVAASSLAERVPGARHQGVCAAVSGPGILDEAGLRELLGAIGGPLLVLALDGVQDPHNLGACLRSAAGLGADALVMPRDRAARVTPTVERTAAGTAGRVPIAAVTNLARTLEALKSDGLWVVGTARDAGEALTDVDLAGAVVLVLGGEEKGLRPRTRAVCDRLVAVPLVAGVDSLNVSVAAGICLFEAQRQRAAAGDAAPAGE